MTIIKSLIMNSDGLSFIIAVVTIIITYNLSKRTISQDIIREQHNNLISPIFFILEPYLFKNLSSDTLSKVMNIVNQNKELVDGKLLEIMYFLNENPCQDNFDSLCSYISNTYDKTSKQLGFKTRPISYRVSRKQYKNPLYFFLYIFIILSKGLLFLILSLLIFVLLTFLFFRIFENASLENQTVLLSLICILLLVFANYIGRKS